MPKELLRVFIKQDPIVEAEWEDTEGLLEAVAMAAACLIGMEGVSHDVWGKAAELVNVIRYPDHKADKAD